MEALNMDSLEAFFGDLGIVTGLKRLKTDGADELLITLEELPAFRLSLLPGRGGIQLRWTVLDAVEPAAENDALVCCNDWNHRCETARFYVTRENAVEAACVQPPFCEKPLPTLLVTAAALSKFVVMIRREWAKKHENADADTPKTVVS